MHSLFIFCNIIWICINLNYDRMMIYLQEFCICLHRVFIWVFLLFIIESITWWLKNDEWKWTTQISFGWKIQSLPIYGLLIFMAYNLIAPFMTSIYHFLGMKVFVHSSHQHHHPTILGLHPFKYSFILITAAWYLNIR